MKYQLKYELTDFQKKFLIDNFFKKKNAELHDEFNELYGCSLPFYSFLNVCRRLGLQRGIQIRWSTDDVKFLSENFRKFGDTELATLLNNRQSTYRMVNGEKIFRNFTHKHIEKKRELLGLKRTDEEVFNIRMRNLKEGIGVYWTAEFNVWSCGKRDLFPEGQIRTWSLNGYLRNVIKINGKFKLLQHHNWELKNGPIPKGMVLSCKTNDALNCDPDNWELIDRQRMAVKNTGFDVLSDQYISGRLSFRNLGLRKQILQMPELIELKRNQIKLKRTINELTETPKND